jgi:hypothetical protein
MGTIVLYGMWDSTGFGLRCSTQDENHSATICSIYQFWRALFNKSPVPPGSSSVEKGPTFDKHLFLNGINVGFLIAILL